MSVQGGAICDTLHCNTTIKRSGFYRCNATSRGGSILKQNGEVHLSNLCFEKCSVIGNGNGEFGHCCLIDQSNGILSRATAWECGLEHLKYGDTPFAFTFSAATTKDLNSSWCFGWGSIGTTYWHNLMDSEEVHTVYACSSGEMANEINWGRGSITRHNSVNCSSSKMRALFWFEDGTATLIDCCYFDNSYGTVCMRNAPTIVRCLAYPPIPDFGVCKLGDLHTCFLNHASGCDTLPSGALTHRYQHKISNILLTTHFLISV